MIAEESGRNLTDLVGVKLMEGKLTDLVRVKLMEGKLTDLVRVKLMEAIRAGRREEHSPKPSGDTRLFSPAHVPSLSLDSFGA